MTYPIGLGFIPTAVNNVDLKFKNDEIELHYSVYSLRQIQPIKHTRKSSPSRVFFEGFFLREP